VSGSDFLQMTTTVALWGMTLALFLVVIRIIRGPTLPDRVLGLDLMTTILIGYVGIIAIRTGFMLYLDIAISLGLVGFLSTIAFARYVLTRGSGPESVGRHGGR
jgi:multicomponent Na+:H+ antiporter subunit F